MVEEWQKEDEKSIGFRDMQWWRSGQRRMRKVLGLETCNGGGVAIGG